MGTASPPTNRPEELFAGIIVPFDMALDREMWRWVPGAVTLLFTRTPYTAMPVTVQMAEAVGDLAVVERGVLELRSVSPSVFVYGCTSGSFVNGVQGEQRMVEAMETTGGGKAVTTSGALLAALAHLDVHRVATATPYDRQVTDRLTAFLSEADFDVVGSAHLGLTGDIWKVPYEQTVSLVRAADSPDAEAIVISCTNLATYDVIAPLEEELGKPVVSANQVTMWAALHAVARQAVGPGQRLLASGTADTVHPSA
jgi:maleate isomerase